MTSFIPSLLQPETSEIICLQSKLNWLIVHTTGKRKELLYVFVVFFLFFWWLTDMFTIHYGQQLLLSNLFHCTIPEKFQFQRTENAVFPVMLWKIFFLIFYFFIVVVPAHYGAVGANDPAVTVPANSDTEWTLPRHIPSGRQALSGKLDRGTEMVWHHCHKLNACFLFLREYNIPDSSVEKLYFTASHDYFIP